MYYIISNNSVISSSIIYEYHTFGWHADWMETRVLAELNAIGVHSQECDIVVVRRWAVSLVFDYS